MTNPRIVTHKVKDIDVITGKETLRTEQYTISDEEWEAIHGATNSNASQSRKNAFREESDPLIGMMFRGEITLEEMQTKMAAIAQDIRDRFPKISE